MAVLVDTGALFALVDADDRHHSSVAACVARTTEALIVPVTVLPEIDYLVATRLGVGPEIQVLESVASGELRLEPLTLPDLRRAIELVRRYADNQIGLVDASIVALAERLGITRILTVDHRHFRAIRPRHCAAFELVP